MELPGRAILVLAFMAVVVIAAPDVDAVMYERPERVQEVAWNEEGPVSDLLQAESSALQVKQALATAHVNEDKASLALSSDAQALEHLKGQMSLEVVQAKQELKSHPTRPSASAHRAATIAKKVMKQTGKVSKDQTKERLAKIKVKEAEQLLADSAKTKAKTVKAPSGESSDHFARAGANLAKVLSKVSKSDKKDAVKKSIKEGDKLQKEAAAEKKLDAKKTPGSDDTDPISKQLASERDKYHKIEHESALAVEHDKHDVAEDETEIQDLKDKLTRAQKHYKQSNLLLKKHMEQHALTEHLYMKYSGKESHYKKMAALKAKITRQENMLRLQQMKIRDSKEMLNKSLDKEQDLEQIHENHKAQEAQKEAAVGYNTGNGGKTVPSGPAVNAAVDAVSSNLGHQHIAKELAPQIEKLKASGLKGTALKAAIDDLVAKTVKARVGNAFKTDPAVSAAVKKAATQVQAKRNKKVAGAAVAQATGQVEELTDAGHALAAAERGLDENVSEEEELEQVQELEQVWGRQ